MPLIDDVLMNWMGFVEWFIALNLQNGFWQIMMNYDNVKKMTLITKTRLYEWLVMPLRLNNATNMFSKTTTDIFEWL